MVSFEKTLDKTINDKEDFIVLVTTNRDRTTYNHNIRSKIYSEDAQYIINENEKIISIMNTNMRDNAKNNERNIANSELFTIHKIVNITNAPENEMIPYMNRNNVLSELNFEMADVYLTPEDEKQGTITKILLLPDFAESSVNLMSIYSGYQSSNQDIKNTIKTDKSKTRGQPVARLQTG